VPQADTPDTRPETREEERMPTYVSLIHWTDQGMRNVKDTLTRRQQARAVVERAGGRWIAGYYPMGHYDTIVITEFPDDETAAAVTLAIAAGGNMHAETLRAFTDEDMEGILQKMTS
jgi:uncharacterized protein with GYD domain